MMNPSPNYLRRRVFDLFMRGMTIVATLLALVPLFLIIGYVFIRGGSGLIYFPDEYARYEIGVEKLVTMLSDRQDPQYDRDLFTQARNDQSNLETNLSTTRRYEERTKAIPDELKDLRASLNDVSERIEKRGATPEREAEQAQLASQIATLENEQATIKAELPQLASERTTLIGDIDELARSARGVSLDDLGSVGLRHYFPFFTESAKPAPVMATSIQQISITQVGGVFHGIVGTFLIVGASLLIALPVGILAGVFLSEYPSTQLSTFIRFSTDVLSAAPSIIVGVTAYVLVVQRTKEFSGLAGSVALSVLMVPVITRTTEEMLKLVPTTVREAAFGLGSPKWWLTLTVVIPAAMSGIVTGALLAFARAAGETAPLLLTILGKNQVTWNLLEPMAALPLITYKYTENPSPIQNDLAWTSAMVLTMLVLLVNIMARWVTRKRTG